MINIRVLLIIRVLIILKYFGDLDFKCYINNRERGNLKKKKEKKKKKKEMETCVQRERANLKKKKQRLGF